MRRLLFVPLLLAFAGVAWGQTFPPVPAQGTVFDGAEMLSPGEETSISELSQKFQRDTGGPIAVATLESLDRYEAKSMGIEKYATALFNGWRVGNRNTNGGILLVVSKADHKIQIALGKDWQRDYDAKAAAIAHDTIAPLFKKGQFDEGILQGCQALADMAGPPDANSQGPAGPPIDESPFGGGAAAPLVGATDAPSSFGGGWLCMGGVVGVGIVVAAVAARRRRRYGPASGNGFGQGPMPYNTMDDPRDDSGAFLSGVVAGQIMSQPTYDPTPLQDPDPGYDPGPSFDSGSDSGGSFDSGSSDGGGGGSDW